MTNVFYNDYIYIYIYAFSRRFYPKRLTNEVNVLKIGLEKKKQTNKQNVFSSYVNCSYILFHKLGLKDQKKSPHTLAHRPSPQKKSGQKWSEVDRGDGLKHQVWMWLPHLLVIWLTKTHLITRCKQGLNERVIQSFKRLIHSETKQSKWLSLWMGHWITRIVHNMDSFSNKTLLCFAWKGRSSAVALFEPISIVKIEQNR